MEQLRSMETLVPLEQLRSVQLCSMEQLQLRSMEQLRSMQALLLPLLLADKLELLCC